MNHLPTKVSDSSIHQNAVQKLYVPTPTPTVISHVTIRVKDLSKFKTFYEAFQDHKSVMNSLRF
jgi:catechol-2,3-dioxygenase